MPLADQLKPCGPVVDEKAATRIRGVIAAALWTDRLERAWPALAPVFAASS
jgi:glutamate-ammonia-ligase adenylyltransferase